MCLFVLGQGSILDSYNLNFREFFMIGLLFSFKNFEKENKNNLIYAEVAMYYDILHTSIITFVCIHIQTQLKTKIICFGISIV
jgi:hypothetical protein